MLHQMISGIFFNPPQSFEQYPSGSCFEKMIVGQQSAWGLGSGFSKAGPSLRGFRTELFKNLKFEFPSTPSQHVINLYIKSGGWNGPVWPDICDLQPLISNLFLEHVEVRCVDLSVETLANQFAIVSRATLHVTPHGALSYLLMFAREGSTGIMLVDDNCETLNLNRDMCRGKEMHFMPYLPWTSVFYYKRGHGQLTDLILHAVVESSFKLNVSMPEVAS
jgi:hypothetical protein